MAQDIIYLTLCDVCLSVDDARADAKPYQVTVAGTLMDLDLCDVHAKPLSELADFGRAVKASRRKGPKPTAAASPADVTEAQVVCDVPGCGRPFTTNQGLAMHRYRAHGIRSETPAAQRRREQREPGTESA